MSAWLVSEKSMANLAETLCAIMNNPQNYIDYDTEQLRKLCKGKTDIWGDVKVSEFGRMLYEMNDKSLRARYGDDEWWLEDVDREYEYHMFDMGHNLYYREKYQLLKSLRCYLYQCNEGDVPECELYKALANISCQVAWDIIYNLLEYKNAKWE